ncbi:MAG: UvrB/UvrC motif-containing protein, partial [Burkholderiales bacterium]|nr:UvrB/UvrC motif-containing protein [Burkholderiales bacterium]
TRSLIQTIGRAARHINGTAILYADKETNSMRVAIGETNRRRATQIAYNAKNGIVPRSVSKGIKDMIDGVYDLDDKRIELATEKKAAQDRKKYDVLSVKQLETAIKRLEREMVDAARNLEFEQAAKLRDELRMLRNKLLVVAGGDSAA